MTGELAGFDNIPPERIDRIVAWCYLKYPHQVRNAAIAVLRRMQGIPPDRGAQMVDRALWRAQGWTQAEAEARADEAEGWDVPVPLSVVLVLPAWPAGIFPPLIDDMVAAVAESTQTPPDLPAMVALSALAAACGGRAVVQVRPQWDEPLNLFVIVALPPGSRKSGVHKEMTAPLLAAEQAMSREAAAGITEARTLRQVAEKAAARAAAEAAASHGDPEKAAEAVVAAQFAEAIVVPVPPRMFADDATPEAAATLMAEQGGRLAILSAEGGPFVSLAGRYSREPNLEVFLKGHAGDALRVDRKGRPPEFIEHPALTLGLTVQPEVLRMIARMPGFHGRGLIARGLYSLPENLVGSRRIRTASVPEAVGNAYHNGLRELACLYAPWTDPARFQLSPEALELLLSEAQTLEPRLAPGAGLGHIADWGAKLAGAIARIAGLLQAAENLQGGWLRPVTPDTMTKAIDAGRYFTAHALAVYDHMGADPATEDARAALAWIKRAGRAQFTRRDLHRGMSARFRKAEDTDPALQMLSGNGWIREIQGPRRKGRGRPPSATFAVHPSLLRAQT